MIHIGILGAGTWGIALARMLLNQGYSITVWSAIENEVEEYSNTRRHKNLPGMVIPNGIEFTTEIKRACINKDVILFAVPSVFVRSTARNTADYIKNGQVIVDVAKGLEPGSLYTMTQVIDEELRAKNIVAQLVALSGPTHAEEVAKDMPTTIVAASSDIVSAEYIQNVFMNDFMRVYTNTDVLGVELCGALKNVIALAVGASQGLGYGDNTKAALITRGMAEITRLGIAMGCDVQTFAGLAGIGDLIITATSVHSRNNKVGYLIGQGKSVSEAIAEVGMVVEGINALTAALELKQKYRIEMPIVEAVDAVVNKGIDASTVVALLMGRSKKSEIV